MKNRLFNLFNMKAAGAICVAIAVLILASCTPPTKVFKSDTQRDYDDNLYWMEFHCFKDNTWECVKMTQGQDSAILFTGTYSGNVFKDTSDQNKVIFKTTAYCNNSDNKMVDLPPYLQRTDNIEIHKGQINWENILASMRQ